MENKFYLIKSKYGIFDGFDLVMDDELQKIKKDLEFETNKYKNCILCFVLNHNEHDLSVEFFKSVLNNAVLLTKDEFETIKNKFGSTHFGITLYHIFKDNLEDFVIDTYDEMIKENIGETI